MDAPIGGCDYPRTLREFNAWFADKAACLDLWGAKIQSFRICREIVLPS